jgi:hypothetical protein
VSVDGDPDRRGDADRAGSADSATTVRIRRPGLSARRVLGGLAGLVRLVCRLIALLLVLYIGFVWGRANPANSWTIVVTDWAQRLNLGLGNLFSQPDPRIAVLINYGIAAVIWLVVGSVLSRLLRRY